MMNAQTAERPASSRRQSRHGRLSKGLLRAAAACVLVLPLAACGGFLNSESAPVQSYLLRAAPVAEPAAKPINATIRVSRPLASPGLESDRIMLVQSDRRLNNFTASRWAGSTPEVLETLTVDTLRGTGLWSVVQDSRSGFPADYYLQITIRRFEADYTNSAGGTAGGPPTVHVSLSCVLGRRSDRELITSFVADAAEPSSENRLAAVVEAFERATNKALTTVAERTVEAVKTSKAPSLP
jgi:cholesterol transport system auxiliary component